MRDLQNSFFNQLTSVAMVVYEKYNQESSDVESLPEEARTLLQVRRGAARRLCGQRAGLSRAGQGRRTARDRTGACAGRPYAAANYPLSIPVCMPTWLPAAACLHGTLHIVHGSRV